MPLKSRERVTFYPIETKPDGTQVVSEKFVLKTTIDMDITSFEMSDDAPDASMFDDLKDDEEEADKEEPKTEKEDPGACDCSCEKYKELMAMGKKKKKDMDMSKLQQIDMNCIQSCAMEWSKCAKN